MLGALLAATLAASPVMLPPGPFGDSSPFALGKRHPALSILEAGAGYSSTDKTLSTATGEPVPTTRASAHTCTQPDGTIEDLAVDEPCVSGGALAARAQVVNLAPYSEDFTHAAWVTFGPVEVDADVSGGPRGTWDRMRITGDASLPVFRTAYLTANGGPYAGSVYLAAEEGTQTVAVGVRDSTAGTWLCGPTSATVDTVGERVGCVAVSSNSGNDTGLLIYPTGSSTGGIVVGSAAFATAAQLTATSTLQDYCPTEGTAATCEGEVTTVDASALDPDEGCACATITPSWTGAPPGNITRAYLWQAADTRLLYSFDSDFMFAFDGSTLGVAAGFVEGEPRRYCTRWSVAGTYLKIENVTDGASNSRASFAGWATALGTLGLGSVPAGGLRADATLTDIVLDTDPEGCR